MRMGEVELGGVLRKERRMRLFGELVARVLKGGCVMCFWMGRREGWGGGEKHLWEECKFESSEMIDFVLERVKEIGIVGGNWSDRGNSGCNWCWLPKFVCNTWVENEKGSWISRRKGFGGMVRCKVRWMDVVCLGYLMIYIERGGEKGSDVVHDWVHYRVGVYKDGEEEGNKKKIWDWLIKRQLWCLRELKGGIGEDEDEDGLYDFEGINEGNRGWRDGIETNGICSLLWKCRFDLWDGLELLEGER